MKGEGAKEVPTADQRPANRPHCHHHRCRDPHRCRQRGRRRHHHYRAQPDEKEGVTGEEEKGVMGKEEQGVMEEEGEGVAQI